MSDQYEVKALDPRRIDQAFPVVQATYPGLTLDRWRRFALCMAAGGDPDEPGAGERSDRGVMVAQLGRHYLNGVFAWQVVPDLCHGHALQVDLFVAHDMFDPTAAAEAMMLEMERLARRQGCEAVHVSLPRPLPESQLDRFGDLGHRIEGVRLCKDRLLLAAE